MTDTFPTPPTPAVEREGDRFYAVKGAIERAMQDERDGKPCGCIIEAGCEARGYDDPAYAASGFIWAAADAALRAFLSSPSQEQAGAVAREFTNELGNAIRITIEGPTSVSENILTPMEAEQLRTALNEGGDQRAVDALAAAIDAADDTFGYEMHLTNMVDGIATYTLKIGDQVSEHEEVDGCYVAIAAARNKVRASAILSALAHPQQQGAVEVARKALDVTDDEVSVLLEVLAYAGDEVANSSAANSLFLKAEALSTSAKERGQ